MTTPTRALLLDDEEFRFLTNLLDIITESSSDLEKFGRAGKLLRACERALSPEMGLQSASTENLLAEVARRMQGSREPETEPSPAPAIPSPESTHKTAPESSDQPLVTARAMTEAEASVSSDREFVESKVIDLTAREVTAQYRAELAGIADEKGWAEMEPETLAKKVATLRDLLANGIPADIPITCTPDVLSLYGVDLDEMEAACRMPTRVEVRPESVDKRYAVLAFFRGDLQAIIGFRFPKHPGCMAIYLGSMLEADAHHVEHTGGGWQQDRHARPERPADHAEATHQPAQGFGLLRRAGPCAHGRHHLPRRVPRRGVGADQERAATTVAGDQRLQQVPAQDAGHCAPGGCYGIVRLSKEGW